MHPQYFRPSSSPHGGSTIRGRPPPSPATSPGLAEEPLLQMLGLELGFLSSSSLSCVITNDLKHFFLYYLNIRIFKKYTIILCSSASEEEMKLMCVRLKWYHSGNWQSLNYPRKKKEKKRAKKESPHVFPKQNELCVFSFLFSVHLDLPFSLLAVPQSWPGTGGWYKDHHSQGTLWLL